MHTVIVCACGHDHMQVTPDWVWPAFRHAVQDLLAICGLSGWVQPSWTAHSQDRHKCCTSDIGYQMLCRYLQELDVVDKPCTVFRCPDSLLLALVQLPRGAEECAAATPLLGSAEGSVTRKAQEGGHHTGQRCPGAPTVLCTVHPARCPSLQAACQCCARSQLVACMWVLVYAVPASCVAALEGPGRCMHSAGSLLATCRWAQPLHHYMSDCPLHGTFLSSSWSGLCSWSSALVTVACYAAARIAPLCTGHLPVPSHKRSRNPGHCCCPSLLPLQPPSLPMQGHWGLS